MINHLDILCQIRERLLFHITTLSTYPVFDPNRILEEFDISLKKVSAIVDLKNLTKEDQSILKEINKYSQVLSDILSQRVAVHMCAMNSLKVSREVCNNEIGTSRNDNQENEALKSKNRRLSKDQLEILEGWFQKNKQHPYLQKEQTDFLMRSTRLSKSQVQNWYVTFLFLYIQ